MSEKKDFSNKKKVVTFQLVHKSRNDSNNTEDDQDSSNNILIPIEVGSEVDPGFVDRLAREFQPKNESSNKKKPQKKGIGSQFNKYFGDFPDDGVDYTKFFKPIDEEADDGVFIAPDGSIHELNKREISNVDILVNKLPNEFDENIIEEIENENLDRKSVV